MNCEARFDNVQGLVSGNNVRYAGIEAGTVKRVNILNDTTIEVTMLIEKMNTIIRKNAIVIDRNGRHRWKQSGQYHSAPACGTCRRRDDWYLKIG